MSIGLLASGHALWSPRALSANPLGQRVHHKVFSLITLTLELEVTCGVAQDQGFDLYLYLSVILEPKRAWGIAKNNIALVERQ